MQKHHNSGPIPCYRRAKSRRVAQTKAAPRWHTSFSARGWRSVKKTIEGCRTYRKRNLLCTVALGGLFSIYEIASQRFPGRMIIFPVRVLNGF